MRGFNPFFQMIHLLANKTRGVVSHFKDWAYGLRHIRSTKKLCYPPADFSVHMISCHRHVSMALWCLKSFSYYAEISPLITIHDDGTLTNKDIETLHNHLSRCKVIRKSDADNKMEITLKSYQHCLRMRRIHYDFLALKLFDPWFYSQSDKVVLMDSDILFFQRPTELLNCVEKNQACFNSDYQNEYAFSVEELRNYFGISVLEKVNAGLLALRRDKYDLDLIERYLNSIESQESLNPSKHEQTLYAVLLSLANAQPLNNAYQISRQKITAATVSHHFVSDGSRQLFTSIGIRELIRRGIFTRN
jgi:hypothetical protein